MIPLAQYFADSGTEDFTPFQPAPARKLGPAPKRPVEGLPVRAATPTAASTVRSLKPAPRKSAEIAAPAPAPRVLTEARVSLREVEAERAAFAAERAQKSRELAEAVAAAHEAGLAEGRALALQELEASSDNRIEEIRLQIANDHDTALVRTRGEWTSEQSDRLADLLILQVAILEETIKLNLNSVLRPLALDARRRQTLEELVGAVKTIALDGMAYKIAASGPSDLLAALEDRLGDHATLLSFEADDSQSDIRIDADNTVIETRLSSWRLALEEALS